VALKARWDDPDLPWLQKFLEPEWRPDPPPASRASRRTLPDPADGYEVVVTLSDGTPLERSPLHEERDRR
jgi:hypothetical protein